MTRRSVVQLAKHAQHVFRHRLPELPVAVRDRTFRAMDGVRPYTYRYGSFPDSFLSSTPKTSDDLAALAQSPGNTFGTNERYPVPWAAVQGAVCQPLCLKYAERVRRDDRFRPSVEDFR